MANVLFVSDSNLRTIGKYLPSEASQVMGAGCIAFDTTHKYRSRILAPLQERLGKAPPIQLVLIALGTNNISLPFPRDSENVFKQQLVELIEEVRRLVPRCSILLSEVLPRMNCTADEGFTRELYNEKMALLSDTMSAVYVAEIRINRTPDLFRDRVHVNDAGAKQVASQWVGCVDSYIRQESSPCPSPSPPRSSPTPPCTPPRLPIRLVVTANGQTRSVAETRDPLPELKRGIHVSLFGSGKRSRSNERPPSPEPKRTVTFHAQPDTQSRPTQGATRGVQAEVAVRLPGHSRVCAFVECTKPGSKPREHFMRNHAPHWIRLHDGAEHMAYWAHLLRQIMDVVGDATIHELHQRVCTKGWFPVNRSEEEIEQEDTVAKRLVRTFAEYLAIPEPESFAETLPKSPAMLVHWRVLRCVMQFGLNKTQRRHLYKLPKPSIEIPDRLQ